LVAIIISALLAFGNGPTRPIAFVPFVRLLGQAGLR
jgi:hypothetical protein